MRVSGFYFKPKASITRYLNESIVSFVLNWTADNNQDDGYIRFWIGQMSGSHGGLHLALVAMLLQLLTFWQVLLPTSWQILPVCEKISALPTIVHHQTSHVMLAMSDHDMSLETHSDHQQSSHKQSHKLLHDCPFCLLHHYSAPPPDFLFIPNDKRINVWLISYKAVWFEFYQLLKQLYLMPQGRAPPV